MEQNQNGLRRGVVDLTTEQRLNSEAGISDAEFGQFQKLIYEAAGISLSPMKKALVTSRLAKRLRHHGLNSYRDYFSYVTDTNNAGEFQIMVDSLTTNETFFFREPKHFDLLRKIVMGTRKYAKPFRVWSAASSSGEEAYSIAMVLDDVLRDSPWEVVGTDISTRVLKMAQTGVYSTQRTTHIPPDYLTKYCLKGVRTQEGTIMVEKKLRQRVSFTHLNLLHEFPPQLGMFDVIFLRNVMIYFDAPTKEGVVQRIFHRLEKGGHFLIGHSESLNGVKHEYASIAPSIYKKL